MNYCISFSIISNTEVSLYQHELRKMTLNFQFMDKNHLICNTKYQALQITQFTKLSKPLRITM